MARKYEVHIDGKVLIIGDLPDFVHLADNWLAIRVEEAGLMPGVVRKLSRTAGLVGAHVFGPAPDTLWQWFAAGYRLVEAAGGTVTDEHGRLLAIHRLGRWDLPKGKVEAGEGLEEAALREVREECGAVSLRLLGPLCRTWHTYARGGREHLKCTHWFDMAGNAADPLVAQAEEDIDAVCWMDAGGVARMRADTYPSLHAVLNAWEAERRRPA